MKAGSTIDWIDKNLNRVKTVALLVLIILFGLSIARSGCDRDRANDLVERVTGLNVRNDLLLQDIKIRDSLIVQKDLRIQRLQDSIAASEDRSISLEGKYGHLKGEYDKLADILLKIPADSSYKFLTKVAYPYNGQLKYPFNEPQVKGIHKTFLEKESLEYMNGNLLVQLKEKDVQLDLKDTTVYEYQLSMKMMENNREDLDKVIQNKDKEIKIKDKQIKKEHKGKRFWQIAGGAIIIVLAVLGLSGG